MSALDPHTIAQLAAALPATELAPILRAFVTDLTRLARDYQDAADADAARRAAHALAGTAAGIGALRLEAVARRAMAQATLVEGLAEEISREAADAVLELVATADRMAA